MAYAQVQFAPWDKVYDFSLGKIEVRSGDFVIVETELGLELGKVLAVVEGKNSAENGKELKSIIRQATYDDIAQMPGPKKKEEALNFCRSMIERYELPMKLVDVHFSFDGNKMNFAFISDGRVDFRELVKELAAYFGVNIRLTQIGTRDEAKITGDCGPCGKELCCRKFLQEFSSITSEMAEAQQVVHRGSDRISGMCGRLMCCLSYEYEGYKEMAGKLPPLGTRVNVDGSRGVIVGHHVLEQSVDVKLNADKEGEKDMIIKVDINRHRKNKK
ncbi:stage 0 sporulation protein [Candidatus Falkowbacteria bacterium]|jgi:cell fate regulator YaaT (PSP1 superfamily)|nr:stage 0 sporulation protein [Candidatus Falkowbacteria bacterium]